MLGLSVIIVYYNLRAKLLTQDYINPADSRTNATFSGAHQSIFGRQSVDFMPDFSLFVIWCQKLLLQVSYIFSIGQHLDRIKSSNSSKIYCIKRKFIIMDYLPS